MPKVRIFSFSLFFVLVAFLGTASSEDSVKLNHFKCFKGRDYPGQYIKANLVTAKITRVQIIVTKLDEILECHRLVAASKGVIDGKFRGAQSWGYILPAGIQGRDLDVNIFVLPMAGGGEPILYEINTLSAEDKPGFYRGSVVVR